MTTMVRSARLNARKRNCMGLPPCPPYVGLRQASNSLLRYPAGIAGVVRAPYGRGPFGAYLRRSTLPIRSGV